MNRHGFSRAPRLARGAVVVAAIVALAAAGAAAPAAADTPDSLLSTSGDAARSLSGASTDVSAALARDLGLSSSQVDGVLAALTEVDEVAESLRAELGAAFGGVWFDAEAGALVVATTDPSTTAALAAAGAMAEVVTYSESELESVHQQLDDLIESDPAVMADAHFWRVDVTTNQVVLAVDPGSVAEFESVTATHGDAVRVETSAHQPRAQDHDGAWYDGGTWHEIPTINSWCSTAFNVHNPNSGQRYFLTAGHCGEVGWHTQHGGIDLGPYVESTFPVHDEALVQITNSHWNTGPFVWQWPGVVGVQGARSSPVGTPVCHSGRTTELTCGVITGKNVTVNYADGNTVFGMGQHNACTEPGDSGGATYSPGAWAEGIHSGGSMIDWLCLEKFGLENIAFYQEVTDTLGRYQAQYGVQLTTS